MHATSSPIQELASVLKGYRDEMEKELNAILEYWSEYVVDQENGGFYGSVDNNNQPLANAPKGIVLTSRICWAFSAGYNHAKKESWLTLARRAYEYIRQYFVDADHGGVFWSLDQQGRMLDGRKQVYGLAFCIYGLSEYHRASGDPAALSLAKELYELIEKYSYDEVMTGYVEAFTRDWKAMDDLRLSDKDDNERKTTNTHLHVLEAYSNLYLIWPDEKLKKRIGYLLNNFDDYLINRDNHHLNLFLDDDWSVRSTLQSFGHDIEAAWLLQQCAEVAGSKITIEEFKETATLLTAAAEQRLDPEGGLWYEFDPSNNFWIREKHSWPQAEAMIGFLNEWQNGGSERYLQLSIDTWRFVQQRIRDNEKGEWYWGIDEQGNIMDKDKAGFWKCPYHNTRACIEISKRLNSYLQTK